MTCKGVAPTGDVPIYANVNGNIVQVARSKDGSKYQVGWSTEMKLAKTGDYKIRYAKDKNNNKAGSSSNFSYCTIGINENNQLRYFRLINRKMSADICSDVGQQINNEAKESSENLQKVHLSTANENNCDSNKIGKFHIFI